MSVGEELSRQYEARFSDSVQYRNRVWQILVSDFFSRYVGAEDTVLDLGCGWGEFINQVPARQKFGMDLNPDSSRHLAADVSFLNQDCSADWELPDQSLDVVFTSNFFEHLPDKKVLDRTLSQVARCLRPGGRLICMGPNIKYVPGAYWDFYDHYLPLTERSLSEGLELSGFQILRSDGRFLPYTMVGQRQVPGLFIRAYLRMPWAWRFFGAQFLVVAAKPQ